MKGNYVTKLLSKQTRKAYEKALLESFPPLVTLKVMVKPRWSIGLWVNY